MPPLAFRCIGVCEQMSESKRCEVLPSPTVGSPVGTRAWHSLRLNSRPSVLALQGSPTMKSLSCPNRHDPPSGKGDIGAVIRHAFYTTRSGKRRRCQCRTCGKTFCGASAVYCW